MALATGSTHKWIRPPVPDKKKRVLFLCTHNSARSQMAEGWLRHLAGDQFEVESAGTEATVVRPLAVRAMQEAGIDISSHKSKTSQGFISERWDFVITVCDQANQACPVFPGAAQRLHWSLRDPSQATGPQEDQLNVYRQVRDEIRHKIAQFVADRA